MARKVLLIDDDRLQFHITQGFFQNFQTERYDLEWASTYEEGLSRLLSGEFAACLLDFRLGERDGLQLITDAIAQECRTPIVFLTAETADRVDIAAMNAGALDYLVKGEFTPRMIERSLRYALKLAETLEELRRLSTHDALTGLLSRREFDRVLREEEERALRFNQSFALVTIDVDRFKSVNDTYGHSVGDAVLQEVARRLLNQVRTVDRVARIGGEEFGVILMQTEVVAGLETAERIRVAIKARPIRVREEIELTVTVSAGVAAFPSDARDGQGLVEAADKALYAAKFGGRDRASAFERTIERLKA